MPRPAATRSPTSARRSSTSRSSATRRGPAERSSRATCRDDRPTRAADRRARTARPGQSADSLAGLTPVRAGAALALLLSAAAIYGLAATSAFGFNDLRITGATITDEAAIRDRLGLAKGTNLFEIRTDPLAEVLTEIPAVAAADVSVGLPGTVTVDIRSGSRSSSGASTTGAGTSTIRACSSPRRRSRRRATSPAADHRQGPPTLARSGSGRRSTRSTSTPPAGSPR